MICKTVGVIVHFNLVLCIVVLFYMKKARLKINVELLHRETSIERTVHSSVSHRYRKINSSTCVSSGNI